jgi:cell division topological specificity factor MinE
MKKKSATIAKERLKIAIMSDRLETEYAFMEDLKRDIINVIRKYKKVANIEIKKIQENGIDAITIEVELEIES